MARGFSGKMTRTGPPLKHAPSRHQVLLVRSGLLPGYTCLQAKPRWACRERNTVSWTDPEAPRTRWNRSQRFQLSPAGRKAGLNYREVIVASRAEAGRKSFDVARTEWAARLGLEPTDGLYLGELLEAPRTIPEIAASLDGCGPQRSEVRPALERLVQVRMIELVVPPPAPPPPPRRW